MVVSELRKNRPDHGITRWFSVQRDDQLHLSVITLGEIERGLEKQRKAHPKFAEELAAWMERLTQLYADRVMPVTPDIARRWGRLSAQHGHDGADLLIAAIALSHGLAVVTRNVNHFEPTGVSVINPFTPEK